MDKIRKRIFVFFCMVFLSLIAICTVLKIDTKMTLYGVSNQVEFPRYGIQDICDGGYQIQIDEWYKDNFPLRSWFVRVNNQILYTLGATINDAIIVGKNGWFYTEEYTSNMLTEVAEANKQRIEEYAETVRLLKDKIEKSGKEFVYVITPSKAEVYPEYLPVRYNMLMEKRTGITNNYDYLKEQLTLQGVPFIDMIMILENNKGEIPFFSKTGIHWNYYASSMCAERVVKAIDNNINTQINVIESDMPYGTEQDVYLLSNMFKGIVDDTYYQVSVDYSDISNIKMKKVLEMGTSFSGELEREFFENGRNVWNQYTRYQYFTIKSTSKGKLESAATGDFYNEQLKEEIADADVIIIENNSSYVPDSHYLFVDYILSMSDEELISSDYVDLDDSELCLDFSAQGNAEEYIWNGFYGAEEMGRWAEESAVISVDMASTQDLLIEFQGIRVAPNTSIMFNDTVMWETVESTEFVPQIHIPLDLINTAGPNYITISTDEDIQSPMELGTGEDSRTLAHWIDKIIIRSNG